MPEHLEFWHWWVLGALLITIEMIAPSTVLLWPGIAAGIVGLVLLAAGDMGWQLQVLLFAALSVTSLIVWRLYARARPGRSDDSRISRRGDQLVGRFFTLKEPIVDGRGRLEVDGTIWKIEGEEIDAGARVKIVGVESVILKVEQA